MTIQEQVAIIADELPIEYPRQVYVRKNQEYIQSYPLSRYGSSTSVLSSPMVR